MTDDVLPWLCWHWASTAARFYPPEETAQACMDGLPDDRYEDGSLEEANALGWEQGQHARAVSDVVENYRMLERKGIDARELAERYGDAEDLPDIDWSWHDDCNRLGHVNGDD